MRRTGTFERIARGIALSGLALFVASGLAACREEDQGRHFTLQKGEYQGPADQPLTNEDATRLRERGNLQRF